MSRYIYAALVQSQLIHPDVEPVLRSSLGTEEKAFEALSALSELMMQKMGHGALPANNPFAEALCINPFVDRDYNSIEFDKSLFEYKAESDPLLVADEEVKFRVSELREILATEIDFVRKEGLPFLKTDDNDERSVGVVAEFLASIGRLPSGEQDPGLSAADADPDRVYVPTLEDTFRVAESVRSRNLADVLLQQSGAKRPLTDDPILQTLLHLNKFTALSTSLKVVASLAIAAEVLSLLGGGVDSLIKIAMILGKFLFNLIDKRIGEAIGKLGVTASLMALLSTVISLYSMIKRYKDYVSELRHSVAKVGTIFQDAIAKAKENVAKLQGDIVKDLQTFRLVLAEMVARTLDGERIIGLLSCDCRGGFVLNVTVDPLYAEADPEDALQDTPKDKAAATNQTVLWGAALGGLALMVSR